MLQHINGKNKGNSVPRDIEHVNKNLYSNWYSKDNTDTYVNLRGHLEVFRAAKKLVSQMNRKKVLDIGFGNGSLLELFFKEGCICYGIENQRKAVEKLSKMHNGFKLKTASAYNLPFGDNSFDLVVSSFVLEHLKDMLLPFKEMKRVVKKRGYIIVTIPSEIFPIERTPFHYRNYTAEDVNNIKDTFDFELIMDNYFNTVYDSFLQKFINFRLTKKFSVPLALKISGIDDALGRIIKGKCKLLVFQTK
jgi:ubiquinone/menaquinone biosynthesis C-methylase UbiE